MQRAAADTRQVSSEICGVQFQQTQEMAAVGRVIEDSHNQMGDMKARHQAEMVQLRKEMLVQRRITVSSLYLLISQ